MNDKNSEVLGHLDGIIDSELRGWLIVDKQAASDELTLIIENVSSESTQEKDDSDELVDFPGSIEIEENEDVLGLVPRVYDRPDVKLVHGCDLNTGFKYDLKSLDKNKTYRITVLHERTGFNFNDIILRYSPAVSGWVEHLGLTFFPEYYRYTYRLEYLTNKEAFQHYLSVGIYDELNPSPWFKSEYFIENYPESFEGSEPSIIAYLNSERSLDTKPCEQFDPKYYSETYQDLDVTKGLLCHYTKNGHREGRKPIRRVVPQRLVEEIDLVSDIDPSLVRAKSGLSEVIRYPTVTASTFFHELVHRKIVNKPEVVVAIPFLSIGGADLISTYVVKACIEHYGNENVLLIITDSHDISSEDWISNVENVIVMDQETQFCSFEEKVHSLHCLLGKLCPSKIVNVNSHVMWEIYKSYGKQLSEYTNLYSYLFCFDFNQDKKRVGHITDYLPHVIDCLSGVMFDNETIIGEVIDTYGFSEKNRRKLKRVYVPRPEKIPVYENSQATADEINILWCGRLSHQKRPDVLVQIASHLPEVNFKVYGPPGSSPLSQSIVNGTYSNIHYMGVYTDLGEIDFSEMRLFLNTSEWEGLPTVLIQMMSIGIPILTSDAGGIRELINDSNGWVVNNDDDVEEYVRILQCMILNDNLTQKATKGVEDITQKHSWPAFQLSLREVGILDGKNTSITSKPLKTITS